ncbi:MAG: adenylate/guanylate cyclase domain-containing response regulator [Deltaproteobacteria bacterium]|nr:adenylate/guanylate cyclase domain-containing response regulator [Deltaproteobacteria bacterium]
MKVLACSRSPLLAAFLSEVVGANEGITLSACAELPAVSPDGEPGWVVVRVAGEGAGAGAQPAVHASHPSWVISEVRVGTSQGAARSGSGGENGDGVTVTLPCDASCIVEALLEAQERGRPESATQPSATQVILVAEDSPLQRNLTVSTLKAEGFLVIEAEDGQEALDRLREHPVSLVVTDVEMPRLTGLDLVRAMRSDPALTSIPALVLTTLSGYEEVREGFEAGATDYMVKPRKGERELFLDELVARVYRLSDRLRPGAGLSALVVDDSAAARRMVADSLGRHGFRVTTAGDGAQARGLLENPSVPLPDVVVTDLEMPVMDGLRLTHYVKSEPRTRGIPVVILTGSTLEQHRVLGRGFGADAFLSKPFSEEKLLVAVELVLAHNRLERERRELSGILGRDVIRAIHQEGLQPRRRELTILFSDLAGFSKMCFGREAGWVVELLNDYFGRFVDYIQREQGYVNKFIGDALMALFSHLPGLDPPEVRAVRAGLSFQREMARLNREQQIPLVTRIGINSGEVILGLIGSGERKDYTVIGDQVNRAQRLEGKATPGGVLVSEKVFSAARDWLRTVPDARVDRVDGLELKGIAEPITAYGLTVKGGG